MVDATPIGIGGSRDDLPSVPKASPDVTFGRLRIAGLTAAEAGNLTAWLLGLSTSQAGWTLREIGHLQFLRDLVARGRLRS